MPGQSENSMRSISSLLAIILLGFSFANGASIDTSSSSTLNGCSFPPDVPKAFPNIELWERDFPLDTTVYYSCEPGYYRSGLGRLRCTRPDNEYKWTTPSFTCQPKPCAEPATISKGHIVGKAFDFGKVIHFECFAGYQMFSHDGQTVLTESPESRCLADGTWSVESPTCKSVECPDPISPEHGWASYTTRSFSSKVKYNCNIGRYLAGDEESFCLADGRWSGDVPSCEALNCTLPNLFTYGSYRLVDTSSGEPARVTFTCFSGHQQVSVCKPDGQWSVPPPKCMTELEEEPTTTPQPEPTVPWYKKAWRYLPRICINPLNPRCWKGEN